MTRRVQGTVPDTGTVRTLVLDHGVSDGGDATVCFAIHGDEDEAPLARIRVTGTVVMERSAGLLPPGAEVVMPGEDRGETGRLRIRAETDPRGLTVTIQGGGDDGESPTSGVSVRVDRYGLEDAVGGLLASMRG